MISRDVLNRLRAGASEGRFVERNLILPVSCQPKCVACFERRSINAHRGIVMFESDQSMAGFLWFAQEIRASVGKALGARFWRGLGLGVILVSPEDPKAADLVPTIDTVATETTVIQWLIHASTTSERIAAAHTWCRTMTTGIFERICGEANPDGSSVDVVGARPSGAWASMFKAAGFRV